MQQETDLTDLLVRSRVDASAKSELFAAAYPQLMLMARARLHNQHGRNCLEATELVHETFMRFVQAGALVGSDRAAFFCFAGKVMRSVIVDLVRELKAEKRGGDLQLVTLNTVIGEQYGTLDNNSVDLFDVMEKLEALEPRLANLVDLRVFAGCSAAEAAEQLGVGLKTVGRDWVKARVILAALMGEQPPAPT